MRTSAPHLACPSLFQGRPSNHAFKRTRDREEDYPRRVQPKVKHATYIS